MSQRGAIAIKYFTPSGLSFGQPHLSSHICDVGRKRVKRKKRFHCSLKVYGQIKILSMALGSGLGWAEWSLSIT